MDPKLSAHFTDLGQWLGTVPGVCLEQGLPGSQRESWEPGFCPREEGMVPRGGGGSGRVSPDVLGVGGVRSFTPALTGETVIDSFLHWL